MLACFHFQGDLPQLLRPRWRPRHSITLPITRSASIKDVIEAFGPPHTEIGAIICNDQPVDWNWPVTAGATFVISPIAPPWEVTLPTLLRPQPLPALRFIADATVGRLIRHLRMAGLDVLADPSWNNRDILCALSQEPRLLLSRNLDLLKRKQVAFGRAIRSSLVAEQVREVRHLFGMDHPPDPFSRCLDCNERLVPVPKATIVHRLEPLTLRYFDTFRRCPRCDKLYWAGSHVDRMRQTLAGQRHSQQSS